VQHGLTPPEGFTVRAPTPDDAAEIAELMNEVTLGEAGIPWTTAEEMRDELTSPPDGAPPPSVLLVDHDGAIAGKLQFEDWRRREYALQTLVRPAWWGRGLSALLLLHGERQVAGLGDGREPVAVHVFRFAGNEAAERLFRALEYAHVRTFWMMRIQLETAEKPDGRNPEAIRIRTFERQTDERAVYDAISEAFIDHWGSWTETFERWRHNRIDGEGARFDPTLWFVAHEGDEVVGAACCSATTPRADETAEVNLLGVRRPWRRRGVGLALLRTAFGEMRRRGIARCELGVDAENPTGATRLYERAGMHVAYSLEIWKKTLARDADTT
jgi:mycothiol synthase